MLPVLALWLAVAAILGWLAFRWSWLRRRRRSTARVAGRLGWQFRPGPSPLDLAPFHRFELTRGFDMGWGYNTLVGTFDLGGRRYEVRMGDVGPASQERGAGPGLPVYSYALITLPFPMVPDLVVCPESLKDRVAGAVGFEDVDFESAEFSRRYYVAASHKRFAYDLMHPRMIEFLLRVSAPTVQLHDRYCVLTDGIRFWTPEEFTRLAWWSKQFLELWPEHLLVQLTFTEERR